MLQENTSGKQYTKNKHLKQKINELEEWLVDTDEVQYNCYFQQSLGVISLELIFFLCLFLLDLATTEL